MGAFSYQALDDQGRKVKGILDADSARQIRNQLRDQNLKPIEVVAVAEKAEKASRSTFSRTKVSTAELALFTRQLATLIQSNMPLDEALAATAQQTKRENIKSLLLEVRSRVVEGHTLAYGLGESPKVFNGLYRSMVKAGEHAGFLGVVLDRLADYTESRQHSQQQLQMAMTYPFILLGIAIAIITAMMVLVVPKLVTMFENTKAELPLLTRGLISTSDFLSDYGLVLLAAIILLVLGVRQLLKNEGRRRKFHQLLLKLPIFANMFRAMDTARFASTLSILMSSGVPLLEGLKISGEVLSNLVIRDSSLLVAAAVQEGSSLRKALELSGEFPPMMVHMVASGEASGELENMLDRAAKNQERELEVALATMANIMEPMMMLFMGGMVLTLVLAILLPIMDLNNMVG